MSRFSSLSDRLTLLDTGPLVALLNAREIHHSWVKAQFATLRPPLVTCEPVLAEACHLLRHLPTGREAVIELVNRGVLSVEISLENESDGVLTLLRRYRDLPISLADACLVRLAELHVGCRVMTFDSDFDVYRRDGRHPIETWRPPAA